MVPAHPRWLGIGRPRALGCAVGGAGGGVELRAICEPSHEAPDSRIGQTTISDGAARPFLASRCGFTMLFT